MSKRLPIIIRGTGAHVPERVITNQYWVDRLDTSEEWIVTRTGIRERRRVGPDEATSTVGAEAARRALADAEMSVDDVDVIICATATGDYQFPATACLIHQALGAKDTPAFDVGGACAGFLYGSTVAAGLLIGGIYQTALVIGAEVLTAFSDVEDRRTTVLFGDGAGAAVWTRSDDGQSGILYCDLGTDGTRSNLIMMPAGGSRMPASQTTVAERLHTLKMRGREVFKFAVVKMQKSIDRALQTLNLEPDDLKLIIPHQSNFRIIEAMRERMGLPPEKVAINIDRYGNTSAASVPLCLDEARRNGTLQPGDLVLMIAIGAGMTWGTMVVRL